ncbi:MAG: DUF3857 domain-containing protein [Candidatus Eremiobacteraeota bacterium]|nr:DUF3857 domain-containing protein [Candidatus Eremiobacteraeota bacterium]
MRIKSKILSSVIILTIAFSLLLTCVSYSEKIEKWKDSPGKEKFPDANAIILYDYIGSDYNKDSSVTLTEHEVIKLLKKESFRKYHRISRPFLKPDQVVKVEIARIIKPDGTVKELDKKKQITKSFPFKERMPLYKDMGITTLDFAEAKEGDIIEFKFLTYNKKPWISNYYWALSFTRDEIPILDTQFVVKIFKKGVKIHYFTPGMDKGKASPKVSRIKGGKSYKWQLKDMKSVENEPAAPPLRDRISSVMVSTFPNWKTMSDVLYKAMEVELQPGVKVKEKVKELTRGVTDKNDIILVLADFIRKKRTMNLGFDSDHYTVFMSDKLLEAKVMSSNDAQLLFISMLRAAGFDAYPAIMSNQKHGKVLPQIAIPYQFGTIMAAVKIDGKWKYLNANHPMSKSMSLYPGEQGRGILVLKPGGMGLALTSISAPEKNVEEMTSRAELSSDGALGVKMTLYETGTKRALWEGLLIMMRTSVQKNAVFGRLIQTMSEEAKLLSVDFNKNDDKDRIEIEIAFMAQDYPVVSGNYWIVNLPLIPASRKMTFIQQESSERKFPVLLGSLGMEKKSLTLTLPDDVKVVSLPKEVSLKNWAGSLDIKCKQEGNKIEYSYVFKLEKYYVPAKHYVDLKRLYDAAGKNSREVILLMKEKKSGGKPEARRIMNNG